MSQSIEASDGRLQRTSATRRNILATTRALILEGVIDPTAQQIADRAAITKRTLFRHFADMESLHRAFIEDAESEATLVIDEPFPEVRRDEWRPLLDLVIDRRVRVYETMLPLYISAIWSKYRSTRQHSMQRTRRGRKRLRQLLPEAIATDPAWFEAVDGVLSIEYWVSLRRDQRLSIAKATDVLRLALEKLTSTG